MRIFASLTLTVILCVGPALAKRPQVLPEPMLVNLYALTEASAALQICGESASYKILTPNDQAQLKRLQSNIESLVKKIARKFDDDLFSFFIHTRNEIATRPDKVEEMRSRHQFCGNGLFEQMKRYVYDSRQKLDYFLSQQPDAR
jgi:hypothetical protein